MTSPSLDIDHPLRVATLDDDVARSLEALRRDPARVRFSREVAEQVLQDGRAYIARRCVRGAASRWPTPTSAVSTRITKRICCSRTTSSTAGRKSVTSWRHHET